MTKVDGGRLIVRVLKNEGVEDIFTLRGHQIKTIYNACIDEGIRLIDTHHEQEERYGRERAVATGLRFTRYDEIVETLGGHGNYVERPEDICPALRRAFASGLPACVNVKVDPTASAMREAS